MRESAGKNAAAAQRLSEWATKNGYTLRVVDLDVTSDDSEDEMVSKKRKKGGSSELSGVEQLKKLVFNELTAKGKKKKKGLSVGGVKGDAIEGSGSELVVKDQESGVKKKKKKREEVKAKATKNVNEGKMSHKLII